MNFIWDKLTEWIRELLIEGIMNNLTGLFDQVNTQISGIADNVGKTPQQWNGSIFSMIQGLSDHVVVPIAGAILAVIATLELIQMIIDKNNFHHLQMGVQNRRVGADRLQHMEHRHGHL